MKKQWMLTLGLVLTSPLLLAQTGGSDRNNQDQNQNSSTTQPATPAVPAVPGIGGSGSDTGTTPEVQAPTTDDTGTTSGSARAGGTRAGAAGNPNSGQGRVSGGSSNASQFGSYDSNGDGKLSKDELAADIGLAGRFTEMDKNSDGALSRAEFSTGLRASPQGGASTSSSSSSKNKEPANRNQGSDRTDKDDELNRDLGPGE